jgi:hypothetical protein
MAVTITAEQRDALYDRTLDRLSGIDDVWLGASRADYDTADRLGREYSHELRLVVQARNWAESRVLEDRNRLVGEACAAVLDALGEGA